MTSQEKREELILQFVKDNPGTSEYRVYHDKNLLKEASKDTLILDISHLVEDKKLIIKIELRKNNKIHHLHINDQNEFNQINDKLIRYKQVIEKSQFTEIPKPRKDRPWTWTTDAEVWMWGLLQLLVRTSRIPFEKDAQTLYNKITELMIRLTTKTIRGRHKVYG